MRKPLIYLFSVLSAASLIHAQEPENAAATPTAPAADAAPTPITIEAPAGEGTPAPAPIAPPIEASAQPAVPGTVAPPETGPAPAIPGTVAPPVSDTAGFPGASSDLQIPEAGAPGGARTVNEFQNEDVASVLRLLARQAGINIVVSDQVLGTITMRLENLSPMEAIRVVVTAKNLLIDQQDSVFFIKTAAERQREPTESGHYTFSYAMADKVRPLLEKQLQSNQPAQVDERTNTVYYRDYKSNMANIALFLESVDRPTQQVMIEARLVEVNANPRQSYGINWAGTVGSSASPKVFKYGGSTPATYRVIDDPAVPGGQRVVVDELPGIGDDTLSDFLLKGNQPDLFSTLGQQFAILTVPQMSATLRLLNEDSDAEFLANPRIVTANNLEAKIEITRNQPVPQLNFNEQTATAVFGGFENVDFGNTLVVRPTINKDDFVTLQVKPEISNKVADAVFTFAQAEVSSPIIDKRSLESTVLIKSGDTLAIGGLLQDETSKGRTKVPILGDIPILGYAFQERLNNRTKRNLLVFVTPTVVKQGYGTGLEDQVSGLKNSGEEYADPNGWRNNAKGAIRLVPTSQRQNVANYPKPGVAPAPTKRAPGYRTSAPDRER